MSILTNADQMFISVVCKCDFIIALKDLQICSADFKHIFQLTTFIFDIGKHSILKFIKHRDLHRDVSVQNLQNTEIGLFALTRI